MQSQNKIDRKRIAYMGALALMFNYAEMFLPRIIPFFRLGLGNTIVLLALEMNPLEFLILNLVRIVSGCMLNGTLLSPFFIISFLQGIVSSFFMYGIYRLCSKKKLLSVYGISVFGAAVSTVVQIFTCVLYLGESVVSFLGPMLFFSVFSGFVTAFFADHIDLPYKTPELVVSEGESNTDFDSKIHIYLIILLIICCVVFAMMQKSMWFLLLFMFSSMVFQRLCGRKLRIVPHILLWIFILLCSLLSPSGKVILQIGFLSVTENALFDGIIKASKLSAVMALSQAAGGIRPVVSDESVLSLVIMYFTGLSEVFKRSSGRLMERLKLTLSSDKIICKPDKKMKITLIKTVGFTVFTGVLYLAIYLFG